MPGLEIDTPRMRLRPFTAADADRIAALYGDPAVMRFIDDGRPVPRDLVTTRVLPAMLREDERLPRGLGRYAALGRADGAFLGQFSLRPATSVGLEAEEEGIELGYRLLPAAWGLGYAAEGARALVRAAFTDFGAERVVATTMTVNRASRRVLEKAGLRLVRTFFAEWPDPLEGAEEGDVVYALDKQDWARAGGN